MLNAVQMNNISQWREATWDFKPKKSIENLLVLKALDKNKSFTWYWDGSTSTNFRYLETLGYNVTISTYHVEVSWYEWNHREYKNEIRRKEFNRKLERLLSNSARD